MLNLRAVWKKSTPHILQEAVNDFWRGSDSDVGGDRAWVLILATLGVTLVSLSAFTESEQSIGYGIGALFFSSILARSDFLNGRAIRTREFPYSHLNVEG